ncbi:MAG: GNAT family N-acetyltransferase [Bacteroidota bacterium]
MLSDSEELTLQKLDIQGAQTLLEWAGNEGWNPGKQDYEVFWKTDPDGFYGFYHNDRLIAGGSVVCYGGQYGFMGLFIVHPEFRGHGIGKKLWFLRRDLLLSRLKEGASIGMDGVVEMQPFYAEGGFEIAFKDERYERSGESLTFSDLISPIQDLDFNLVRGYDTRYFGYERSSFLRNWLTLSKSKSFKYLRGDILKGFAVIREVKNGFKIGPLFADDAEIAEELYKACLNHAPGMPVYLDIPLRNQEAVNLVKKYGATYVFECARMYYGKEPHVNWNNVFGITTFELG